MSIASALVGLVSPPAGIALSVLGKVKSAIGGAVDWVFKSATHILIVALALAVAWGARERHWKRVAQSDNIELIASSKALVASAKASDLAWAHANAINHDSALTLIAALNTQTQAIEHWSAVAAKRQNAAKAAQQAAQAQQRLAQGYATQLDAERAQRAATGLKCAEGAVAQSMKGKW